VSTGLRTLADATDRPRRRLGAHAAAAALTALAFALASGACGQDEEPSMPAPSSSPITEDVSERPSRTPDDLPDVVASLQQYGFFAGEEPAAAAKRAWDGYKEQSEGEELHVGTLFDELELLEFDEDRAWWGDIEADALQGNDVYAQTLHAWGRISRGAFRPRGLEERWSGPESEATVRFEHHGRPREVRAEFLDGWIDLCVLPQLNRLIASSGKRFEVFAPFDQTAFVVVLTRRERERLERDRGWEFAGDDELRTANEIGRVGEQPVDAGC
jgi:hypothetical protein